MSPWLLCFMLQAADRIDQGDLVYEMRDSSPQRRAQEQHELEATEINRQIYQSIPYIDNWQDFGRLLDEHEGALNYVNISMLCYKLSLLKAHRYNGNKAAAGSSLAQRRLSHSQASTSSSSASSKSASAGELLLHDLIDPKFVKLCFNLIDCVN